MAGFKFDYKLGQWSLIQEGGSTPSGTTTTTTPSSTTTTKPSTTTTVAPSTTTGTTLPPTTKPSTTKPPITVTSTGSTGGFNLNQEIAKIDDAAKAYREATGSEPSAAWYTAKMLPIQTYLNDKQAERDAAAQRAKDIADRTYQERVRAEENAREDKYREAQLALSRAAAGSTEAARRQERLDALAKEKRDREFQLAQENRQNQFAIDAENRAAARQDALEAIARVRGIRGGEAAAQVFESAAGKRTLAGLQRIKELYDPMSQMANDEFATQLDLLSKDFETARGQVTGAGQDFLQNFVDSIAYKEVPISMFEAPTNPLLAALQSQGAGTGEVQAVSDYAKQFATTTADLGKWAASQLNVGQQNFDIAAKRAAVGATTAALQGLAGQEPRIKAAMQADVNRRLQEIALQRAQASEGVYNRQADMEDRAAAIRAETLAKYGPTQQELDEIIPKKDESKKPDEPTAREVDDSWASKNAAYLTGGLDPNAAAAANEAARKKAEEEAARVAAERAKGIEQAKAMRRAEF